MNLSSNKLFHFTSLENILSILDSQHFQVKYSKEHYIVNGNEYDYYIPMCCFCDIPLKQTKEHIEDYGKNAIGLNKEWGISRGLNPVFYFVPISLSVTLKNLSIMHSSNEEFANAFEHFYSYIKLFKGINPKSNTEKILYNEKEWRFVPYVKIRNSKANLKQIYKSENFSDTFNDELKKHEMSKLDFESKDVKYIIAENNEAKTKIIDFLKIKKEYSKKLEQQEIIIQTLNEVYNDF